MEFTEEKILKIHLLFSVPLCLRGRFFYENSFPCAGFTLLANSKYVFFATPGR